MATPLQLALLTLQPPEAVDTLGHRGLSKLSDLILRGHFRRVLETCPLAIKSFKINRDNGTVWIDWDGVAWGAEEKDGEELLGITISLISLYTQLNYTGPPISPTPSNSQGYFDALSIFSEAKANHDNGLTTEALDELRNKSHQVALEQLARKGEPAYHLVKAPQLLILALKLLGVLENTNNAATGSDTEGEEKAPYPTRLWDRLSLTHSILSLRATVLHLRVLDEPVPPCIWVIKNSENSAKELESQLSSPSSQQDNQTFLDVTRDLLTQHLLALSTLHFYLSSSSSSAATTSTFSSSASVSEAHALVLKAVEVAKLEYHLTGMLGRRTRFQKEGEEKVLMVLRVRGRKRLVERKAASSSSKDAPLPETLSLNDDTLLESIQLKDTTVIKAKDDEASETKSITLSSHILPTTSSPDELPVLAGEFVGGIASDVPPSLHPLDACIILHLLNLSAFTSGTGASLSASSGMAVASDPISVTQLMPYVEAVLSSSLSSANPFNEEGDEKVQADSKNWSVHTMALLARSRLEAGRSRTVERGVWQIRVLREEVVGGAMFGNKDDGTTEIVDDEKLDESGERTLPVIPRLEYFPALPAYPSSWDLSSELARRYLSLGVIKSSLEIFEELEMWEDVVSCWVIISDNELPGGGGGRDKAIEVVKGLLEGNKIESEEVMKRRKDQESNTYSQHRPIRDAARLSKLQCLLGDLTVSPEAYHEALRLYPSSSRALRSLGFHAFMKSDFENAANYLRRALVINPLYVRSWFVLGCACMRIEDWEGAENAFGRAVSLEEEDGTSWSNLASVHLRRAEREGDDASADKVELARLSENMLDANVEPRIDSTATARDEEPGTLKVSFSRKRSAFHCLRQAIKHSYDSWKIWQNYTLVAVEVGELSEATRGLSRMIELRWDKDREESIDLDVLERLVNAVTKEGLDEEDASRIRNPNEGKGLEPRIQHLFDAVILPKCSTSSRVFKALARLRLWQGNLNGAFEARLDAYRCGVIKDPAVETDARKFREAAEELIETVETLEVMGSKIDAAGTEVAGGGTNWKFKVRSIIRTFVRRTKDFKEEAWAEPTFDRLKELEPH